MEYKTNNQNIIYVDWKNKEHIKAVCNLHFKLLPKSILSKFGFLFLSKFYYSRLIKDNSIEVYLYELKGEFVGFVSCTNKPFTFMAEGKKKHFILISMLIGVSILLKFNRLADLLRMKGDFLKYDTYIDQMSNQFGDSIGQFLSFGVLVTNEVLEYYRQNIDRIDEVNIPDIMMNLVKNHFRYNNKKYFFLMAIKSNNKAIKLYKKHTGILPFQEDKNESVIIRFDQ